MVSVLALVISGFARMFNFGVPFAGVLSGRAQVFGIRVYRAGICRPLLRIAASYMQEIHLIN